MSKYGKEEFDKFVSQIDDLDQQTKSIFDQLEADRMAAEKSFNQELSKSKMKLKKVVLEMEASRKDAEARYRDQMDKSLKKCSDVLLDIDKRRKELSKEQGDLFQKIEADRIAKAKQFSSIMKKGDSKLDKDLEYLKEKKVDLSKQFSEVEKKRKASEKMFESKLNNMLSDNRSVEKLLLSLLSSLKKEKVKREKLSNFKYTLEEKNKRAAMLQKQFDKFLKEGNSLIAKEIKKIQKDRLSFEKAMIKNEENQKMSEKFFKSKLGLIQNKEEKLVDLLSQISKAIESIGD